jgi:hypothetical protein
MAKKANTKDVIGDQSPIDQSAIETVSAPIETQLATAPEPVPEAAPEPPPVIETVTAESLLDSAPAGPGPDQGAPLPQPGPDQGAPLPQPGPDQGAPLPQPGEQVLCTCGKQPGQAGPHAKDCPRRGLPRNRSGKPAAQPQSQSVVADVTNSVAATDHTAIAEMAFGLSTGILSQVLGPEWQPRNEQERQLIVVPLAAWMKSKDVRDIPPGLMLCLAIGAYSAGRINQPSTASKLKLGWQWVKVKVGGLFGRKRAKLSVVPATSN